MNTKSTITRVELESLLSEYATGMLDMGLEVRVEESLAAHPDLQHEVNSIRSAFALVNRDTHNAAIDYQTRNLSVHVVTALSSRKKRSPLRHLAWLAPAAVTAVVLVMLNIGGPVDQPSQQTPTVVDLPVAVQTIDTAVLETVKPKKQRRAPAQPTTSEEMIVDDLVADQIVYRMVSETANDNETVTGITDAEIDVLLAAVVSNESL